MENPEVLEKVLMYTGLAGLVVFGVFTLFKGIIQKNIFSSMTKEQSYSVIKLVIRSSLFLAVIGIAAWGYIEIKKDEAYKNKALISKKIKGKIVNENGQPVQNAKVGLKRDENNFHFSDVSGDFLIEVSGSGSRSFDLVVTHSNYQNITKLAEVNFASTETTVNVGELPLRPVTEVDIPDKIIPSSTEKESGTKGSTEVKKEYTNTSNGFTDINLFYNDEGTGCNLQININIGGKIYTPTSNPVDLLDVRTGFQQYVVTGTAYCSTGQCQISGNGQLKIVDGGKYYMVFDPAYTCIATIMDEKDYNALMEMVY
jgi:hypothetical protein